MKYKTIGDLRKFIHNLSDDLPLVIKDGNEVNPWADVASLKVEKVPFPTSIAIDWENKDALVFDLDE